MISILVGAIATFAFGAVWYTFLFGKTWSRLMGFSGEMGDGGNKGMTKPMAINFVVNILSASVVYYLFPTILATSFSEFWKVMIIIWFGFSFPLYVNSVLWEKKNWKLLVLNSVSGLISLSILSAIIYLMQ